MTHSEVSPQTTQGATDDFPHRHGSSRADDVQLYQDEGRGVFRSREGICHPGSDAGGAASEVRPSPDAQGSTGISDSSSVDAELEAEAEQNLADVCEAFPVADEAPKCRHCLRALSWLDYPHMWVHLDGFAFCDPRCITLAEPATPVVISSPAYNLPELKSDADHFAETYRELHDLPFSFVSHLAWAWLMGKQDERLRGVK